MRVSESLLAPSQRESLLVSADAPASACSAHSATAKKRKRLVYSSDAQVDPREGITTEREDERGTVVP